VQPQWTPPAAFTRPNRRGSAGRVRAWRRRPTLLLTHRRGERCCRFLETMEWLCAGHGTLGRSSKIRRVVWVQALAPRSMRSWPRGVALKDLGLLPEPALRRTHQKRRSWPQEWAGIRNILSFGTPDAHCRRSSFLPRQVAPQIIGRVTLRLRPRHSGTLVFKIRS
jgi:hypothetical protein